MVGVHVDGGVDGLEKGVFVDAGEDEACVVERLGTLGRCADAHGRERPAHGGEE